MEILSRTGRPHAEFTKLDRTLIFLQGLLAVCLGVVGLIGANDPDWGDLQRVVVVMLTGLWLGGLAVMAILSRYIRPQWARAALLLAGPPTALMLFVLASRL